MVTTVEQELLFARELRQTSESSRFDVHKIKYTLLVAIVLATYSM